MTDDHFVTQSECAASRKEMFTLVTGIHDDVKKHGTALYGKDGRGGMQRDITKILTVLENGGVRSSLSRNDKVIIALITAISSIIVALITNGVFR